MDYHELRNLVGHAHAAARMERAVECYEERKERWGEPDLPFSLEDVPRLAWRIAHRNNRYASRHKTNPYNPSIWERISSFPIANRALELARAYYQNIELDPIQINLGVGDVRNSYFAEIIAAKMKKSLPRGFVRKLRKTIKTKIAASPKP